MDRRAPWTWEDIGPEVLVLTAGPLVVAFAVLALTRRLPVGLWGAGLLIGTLFPVIGGNAIHHGIRSLGRDEICA